MESSVDLPPADKPRGSDRKALTFAAASGVAAGVIGRVFLSPLGNYVDRVIPSAWPGNTTSQIVCGAMLAIALLFFPPIATGLARRYTFLWGFVPPLITGTIMGMYGWDVIPIILTGVVLTSGPVAAIRYIRSRRNRVVVGLAPWIVATVVVAFAVLWGAVILDSYQAQHPSIRTGITVCKSMAFQATVSIARRLGGTWSDVKPRAIFRVTASRPSSLRFELVGTPGYPTEPPFTIYVSNEEGWTKCPSDVDPCTTTKGRRPLADLDEVNVRLVNPDIIFADGPVTGWYSNGDDIVIDGKQVHPYIRRHIENGTEHMQRLFIGQHDLPMRVSDYEENSAGHFIETRRTDYSDWQMDPNISPAVFNASGAATSKPTAK